MLCPSCRRHTARESAYCDTCGAPLRGADAPLDLVLADETRVPVVDTVTIGRAPGNTLQIADPSVSRLHARILPGNGAGPQIEDAGSSHGTYVDGQRLVSPVPLRDGARIRIGDAEMHVERRRSEAEEGRTMMVKVGATMMISAAGQSERTSQATQFGMKPRVRSGYALKRLDESEGAYRWILRDLKTNKFRRMDDTDAALFELLDGKHSLVDLIGLAEQKVGPGGSSRLARLLSDLGERGFLHGVEGIDHMEGHKPSLFRRLAKPREKPFPKFGPAMDRLYKRGGWILFTKPALIFMGVLMVVGFAAFLYLIIGRYGTPFVVAKKIGIGGAIFLLGRFAFVAVHEVAHGLAMASFGRRSENAGLKLIFIMPYAYVDTSEAWFEPRKNRIAISSAGPVSDFCLGGLFSVLCAVWPPGTVRDIFFNLAFAGYVGAIFNMNPFLDRDGYHIMVDLLKEPQLRHRAKEQLNRRISGKGRLKSDSPVLARYGIASIGWLFVMGFFAIFMTTRYQQTMIDLTGQPTTVKIVLWTLWIAVFIPVFIVIGKPLFERVKGKRKGKKGDPAEQPAPAG